MLLTRLLADVEVVETRGPVDGVEIHAVDFDSRRARLGSLFCCALRPNWVVPSARKSMVRMSPLFAEP